MNPTKSALTRISRFAVPTLLLFVLVALPSVAQETKTVIKEGQDHKIKYNEALEFAKNKQINQAYDAFSEAAELAEAAGDTDIVDRSMKIMAQIDYRRGVQAYKNEDYAGSLAEHQKGIEHFNDYVPNHYGKAKAFQKMDRFDEALPIFQAVMQMDDRKSANLAEKTLRDHYVYIASSALSSNGSTPNRTNAQTALDALEELELYVEPDADVYYYRAEAHKALGQYGEAIEMADQALALHKSSRSDKAKIYFVKGEALMFQGNNTEATDAFTNALFGDYKALAQHYLDELGSSG